MAPLQTATGSRWVTRDCSLLLAPCQCGNPPKVIQSQGMFICATL